jgi:O-succinylbenzoic acid--CoA ligase
VRVAAVDGELRIAGPTLADGYAGEPERTAAAFASDGDGTRWYRTGDAGSVEDGVVRVTGRIDNVIVSGGVNVSLDRVERVVHAVPGLEGAVVVGGPHERWGETPVLVLEGDGAPELLAQARAAAERELGAPARPDRIVALREIPRLDSGKPDRRAITRAVARASQG